MNGDQQGPFSVPQLRDMLTSGAIDAETFVWKDGFADWKPMREVADLAVPLLAGQAERAARGRAPAAAAMRSSAVVLRLQGRGGLFGAQQAGCGGWRMFGGAPERGARSGREQSRLSGRPLRRGRCQQGDVRSRGRRRRRREHQRDGKSESARGAESADDGASETRNSVVFLARVAC